MDTKRVTDIPGLMYLWKVDNMYLAGQPAPVSWSHIKELGVTKIINLRAEGEMDFSEEKKIISELGLDYEQFPIVENGALNGDACQKLNDMLDETNTHFIHCGSANRVAGWLMTYLTTKRGLNFDEAVTIAEENGLSNPGFIEQAEDLIGKLK